MQDYEVVLVGAPSLHRKWLLAARNLGMYVMYVVYHLRVVLCFVVSLLFSQNIGNERTRVSYMTYMI
jgi:hypothetical protein